jgi:hypothetical protein
LWPQAPERLFQVALLKQTNPGNSLRSGENGPGSVLSRYPTESEHRDRMPADRAQALDAGDRGLTITSFFKHRAEYDEIRAGF